MNKLRFHFALLVAKMAMTALKLLGRNATHVPGTIAVMLCPAFFDYIQMPKKVIAITGTNGKTTVTNMIISLLENSGEDFVCNKSGSNISSGIAAVLVANSTLFGKAKKQMAVLEMDERSAPRFLKQLKPEYLVVTNIFRDSYRRNAHPEYIFNLINKYIPKETTLILNGDDPLCSNLGSKENKKFYFGIEPQPFEDGIFKNIVQDGAICPNCYNKLNYSFTRYHHIGIAKCDSCGYTLPKNDYNIKFVDLENYKISTELNGQQADFKLLDSNIINVYNQISAISLMSCLGYNSEKIKTEINKIEVSKTRLSSNKVGNKEVVSFLAKGQNPIACSRAFDCVNNFSGNKSVVLLLDDHYDAVKCIENIAWIFDTDFEFLNSDKVKEIIVVGVREADVKLRLLMAGVPTEKISHFEEYEKVAETINYDNIDNIIIYYEMYLTHEHSLVKNAIIDKLKAYENNLERLEK